MKFSRFAYKKLLHPPVKAVVLIDIIAAPLVVIALVFLSPLNPISIVAYLLSAYALAISVMNSKRIYRNIRTAIMLIMLWNALSMSVRAQRNIRQEELQ